MSTTVSIQNTTDWARTYPGLTAALGNPVAGYAGTNVPLRIANKVLQNILQQPFAFKWNRRAPQPFYLNGLQQDYSTSITDLGWLENCIRIQVNNPMYPPPAPPCYITRGVETDRELLPTSAQGTIENLCWVPNSEAIAGSWIAKAVYTPPSPLLNLAVQPLTQIWDSNGNLQVLTTFGTCGSTPPTWNTVANQTTTDGTSVWTMADPNGITFRVSPLPPESGINYLIQPYYQKKPATLATMNTMWPVPDEFSSLYEEGFLAWAWDAAGESKKSLEKMQLFMVLRKQMTASQDREAESFSMSPGRSLTGVSGSLTKGDMQNPPGLFSGY